MNTYEDTKFVSLNTQHAFLKPSNNNYEKSFLSDIEFSVKDILKDGDDVLYAHVNIESASIPVSFYLINYNTNVLKYTINGSATINTLTLKRGNYDILSLAKELKNQFLLGGYVFTITYDNINGKLTFTTTSNSFTFLSASSGSTINEIIGFDSVSSYSSVGNVLLSEHSASLIGIKKLKITSTNLRTSSVSSGGGGNLIGVISVNAPPRGLIKFQNTSPTRGGLLLNKNISAIDIQVYDENNNLINFNNTEWSITLSITVTKIYKMKEVSQFTRPPAPIAPSAPIAPIAPIDTEPLPLEKPYKFSDKTLDLLMYNS